MITAVLDIENDYHKSPSFLTRKATAWLPGQIHDEVARNRFQIKRPWTSFLFQVLLYHHLHETFQLLLSIVCVDLADFKTLRWNCMNNKFKSIVSWPFWSSPTNTRSCGLMV